MIAITDNTVWYHRITYYEPREFFRKNEFYIHALSTKMFYATFNKETLFKITENIEVIHPHD